MNNNPCVWRTIALYCMGYRDVLEPGLQKSHKPVASHISTLCFEGFSPVRRQKRVNTGRQFSTEHKFVGTRRAFFFFSPPLLSFKKKILSSFLPFWSESHFFWARVFGLRLVLVELSPEEAEFLSAPAPPSVSAFTFTACLAARRPPPVPGGQTVKTSSRTNTALPVEYFPNKAWLLFQRRLDYVDV